MIIPLGTSFMYKQVHKVTEFKDGFVLKTKALDLYVKTGLDHLGDDPVRYNFGSVSSKVLREGAKRLTLNLNIVDIESLE